MTPEPQNMPHLLRQADYILNACGRQIPPANTRWVDIPSHIQYTRSMPESITGTQDIGGVVHKGRVPFMVRAITAQVLPRATQGVYWRLRFANGQYFQSALTSHAMAFGFGSDRQLMDPEVEWKPGEKMFIDLNTNVSGSVPSGGYSVVISFEGVYRFPIVGAGSIAHPISTALPRYFQDPNQNILAPESRFGPGCDSETPAGYWDEEFRYVSPTQDLTITGVPASNILTQIEPGSDFLCREIWPNFPGGDNQGSGSVVFRMRRDDGYVLSSNFLPINTIQGPIGIKELRIKASGGIYWDAYVVNGGGAPGSVVTFGLYFFGVRRRRAV